MTIEALHDFEGRGKKFINPRAVMAVRDAPNGSSCLVSLFGGAELSLSASAKSVAEIVNKLKEEDDDE